ncbi:hypothetical protein ACP70R_046194 [Stipagrostis hirtigluma subsp. patula]
MASTSHDGDGDGVDGYSPCEDETMLPVDDVDEETDADDDDDPPQDGRPPRVPDGAIYNILTLLPPSSVTRSKVTCKNWLSMVSDPSFARDHCAAPGRSVLVFDGGARHPATVVDEAGAVRLALRRRRPRRARRDPMRGYTVQNCCGALACLRGSNGGAQLLNPATGEGLDLGGFHRIGHRSTWTVADHLPWYCLGRCASTGEYKVVRLDVRTPFSTPPHVTCEVLALCRDDWDSRLRRIVLPRWKEVGVWDAIYCPAGRGVHVAGVVYYLAWSVAGSAFIVCFDLLTHELSKMDLPASDMVAPSLSELDGQLCLSLVPGGGAAAMRVYVLNDDPKAGKAWFEMYRLELDGGAARGVPRPLLVVRERRMLVKRADGSLCYYDMDEASGVGAAANEKVVYEHKGRRRRQQLLSGATADVFVESLVPLRDILHA